MRSVMGYLNPRNGGYMNMINRSPDGLLVHMHSFTPTRYVVKATRSLVKYFYPKSEDCFDTLSSLPDELLVHILSFLPIRCAVSTCILSKRWIHLFSLTNCLSFDDTDSPYIINGEIDDFYETIQRERFVEFVNYVLAKQISPVKIFRLVLLDTYDAYDLEVMVCSAMYKGVEEIDYYVTERRGCLPDDLFTCDTLVRLKIRVCISEYGVPIPMSSQLPRLKTLYLDSVTFYYDDSVERLFSGCKLLEELTLGNCECGTECHVVFYTGLLKSLRIECCSFRKGLFEIDAPNLEYLTYVANIGVRIAPSWKHSSSLVKADLSFYYNAEDDSNHNSLQIDRGLLKDAACKATELGFSSDSFELLLTQAEHEEMADFPYLSILRICNCPYYGWNHLTSLIEKSPQLETVKFQWGLHRCSSDPESPTLEALIPFYVRQK